MMNITTSAARLATAAAIARPVSRALTAGAIGCRGTGGLAAPPLAGLGRGAGVGAAAAAAGAAATPGAEAAAGRGAADGAGILILGAAVGLGGRLIRTVSFLGCTLAASAGLGGIAPDGVPGISSAINQGLLRGHRTIRPVRCQSVIAPPPIVRWVRLRVVPRGGARR
jgi:hypothetical protein